jgi:Na+-transporting methylmalonyl-CoA/oxaloacetate decarboxylase gamma subunit
MTPELSIALQITLIGMGLVFGAILLLWLVMALLMRLTAERPAEAERAQAAELALKQRAAAAAVSFAMAQETVDQPHEFPLPPTATVSAWQAVMRTRMLNKRGKTQ